MKGLISLNNLSVIDTKIYKIDSENIDEALLVEAASIIRQGGTVVFPTETVYGIGADALNETACGNIFLAKGRPSDNPLIVHISSLEELEKLVEKIDEKAMALAEKFWPGPMTLVMNKKAAVSDKVTAGLNTVAVRMPKNTIASALIRLSETPIAAPSANISGKPSPTLFKHVKEDMMGKVDAIIDGGSCEFGLESSVIDVTGEVATILRPGSVTKEDVEKILGKCEYDPAIISSDEEIVPKSPGQKYKHYSPLAKVVLYKGDLSKQIGKIKSDFIKYSDEGLKVAVMATEQTLEEYSGDFLISMGDRDDLNSIASKLFNALRLFDEMKVDIILAESVDENGVGKAIMNRLSKASEIEVECD